MNADVADAGASAASTAAVPAGRLPWRWLLPGLVLLVAAGALLELARFDHDAPPRVQLAHDADMVRPIVAGEFTAPQILARQHDAGERLWKYAMVALNGQLDHRLSSLATILLQIGGFALLLVALAQTVRLRAMLGIGIAVVLVALAPALAGVQPPMGSAGTSGLVLLALASLLLFARSREGSGSWWLGMAVAGLGLLWSTAGLAVVLAMTVCAARTQRRTSLVCALALTVAGVALAAVRGGVGPMASLTAIAAWPFAHVGWAILGWAPALLWLANPDRKATPLLDVLVCWAVLQPIALALIGADVEQVGEFLLAALAVNAAVVVALRPMARLHAARYALLAGAWVILVADAVIDRPAPAMDESRADTILARRELRDVLPMALRAPLTLSAADATTGGFTAAAAPQLPGGGGLPVIGTWAPESAAGTGEFVSAPLHSTFPFVQVRVAGALRPPATALVLRTADGKEVAPLESNFTATDRWKRVNFPTPAAPFQVVARDTSPAEWLAITAPVEVGRWTRLAGKLTGLWPFVLAAGFVCLAAGFIKSRREVCSAFVAPGFDWADFVRVVPWLGLFGYALFFSHHVDPTAGPNDSGGYLNSAKLLVGGSVSAAPRIPAGVEIDRDPTLYTPITFHVKGDRLVPEYPVGLPLEVWALAQVLQFDRAVYVLILLQLVLGVVFTERLCRSFGLERGWAWFGAAVVGLSPVYLFQALQPQSDGPALVWVTAAVYWAWTSREKPARAILAGFATALAVLLRPSNVLCILPILACVLGQGMVRRLLYLGLAGLPGALWLMWYQHSLYGNWHTTGYGDVSTSFGLKFLAPTLHSYAVWLPEMFTPLVVLALGFPFLRGVGGRARVVLLLWVVPFVAFYSVYWCTWDNWYNMRFVLPAAPAMLVMALLVARRWLAWSSSRAPRLAKVGRSPLLGGAVAAALLAFLGVRSAARDVLYWLHNNHEHEYAARWVGTHVPANAVVFAKHATGSLMHYTTLPFIRSDHDKARESTALFDQLERAGRPIYALNYHWETAGYTWQGGRGSGYPDLPGKWDRVALMWDNDVMVWKRQPSATSAASGK